MQLRALYEAVNMSTYDDEPPIRQAAMLVASQLEDEFGEEDIHCEHKFYSESAGGGLVITAGRELAKQIGVAEYDQLVYMPAYIHEGEFFVHGAQEVISTNNFKELVSKWITAARNQLFYVINVKKTSMLIPPERKRLSSDDFFGAS